MNIQSVVMGMILSIGLMCLTEGYEVAISAFVFMIFGVEFISKLNSYNLNKESLE